MDNEVKSSFAAHGEKRRPALYVPALAVGVLGVVAATSAFLLLDAWSRERARFEVEQLFHGHVAALQQRIGRHLDVLHDVAGLFHASGYQVTRESFHRFAAPILARGPGLRALEWIPKVEGPERHAHEAAARAAGFPDFRIRETEQDGSLVKAQRRDRYHPVFYVEPLVGNEAALGFDLASNPVRRLALERARDRGEAVATAPIQLVQAHEGYGFLIFQPIYGIQPPPETVKSRRRMLRGFALGVYHVPNLVESAIPELFLESAGLILTDIGQPGADDLPVYASSPKAASAVGFRAGDSPRRLTEKLMLPGRTWAVSVELTAAAHYDHLRWPQWVVLVSMLGVTGVLWSHLNSRRNAEQTLFEEKERALVTLHSIGDGVISTDRGQNVIYLNPIAENLTGWSLEEARGRDINQVLRLVDEATGEPLPSPTLACLDQDRSLALGEAAILISRSGERHGVQDSAAPICGRDGEVLGAVLVFSDVTENRRMMQTMTHQATHDALTGLVNRFEFERRLEAAILSADKREVDHALLYIDLDRFKIVNDTVGHVAGDHLLKEVACLIYGHIRSGDTAARLGGDEFGLLLESCRLEKAIERATSLLTNIKEYAFTWGERRFDIGASIGVVPITAETESTVELLSKGDVACYTAKDLGRDSIYTFHGEQGTSRRMAEMQRAVELSHAIENERLRLFVQPIVPLSPESDGIVHYEFLLRLLDDRGELLDPSEFIPAAERYGLMIAIDRWVVEHAFISYAAVVDKMPPIGISINLSGNSLTDRSMLAFVDSQLDLHRLPPANICFEITETAAITNLELARKFMSALKERGCRFALDDVGSGLSSFNYLKTLPLDCLKIDGSFVRDMNDDEVDCAMVAAINQVGHIMHLKTVAEWVESADVVERLCELGVDYAQGYALGPPRPLSSTWPTDQVEAISDRFGQWPATGST